MLATVVVATFGVQLAWLGLVEAVASTSDPSSEMDGSAGSVFDSPPGELISDGNLMQADNDYEHPVISPKGWSQMVAAFQKTRDAADAEEAERSSPAGVSERVRSTMAFEGLTGEAAVRLATETFGRQLAPRAPDAETLFDGARVEEYRGANTAVLAPSGDEPARLVDSAVPLAAHDEDSPGTPLRPVDLDIERSGSGFEAANAAPDVTLPATSAGALELGSVDVDAGGHAVATRIDADTLAYPNVSSDVDLIVNLTNTGFETFHQLRSREASEHQVLNVDLPAGATLETSDGGSAQIVRQGEPIASVSAPKAWDAQGRNVPIKLDVEGSKLTLNVEHQSGSFAYPILADPEFVEENAGCPWNGQATQPASSCPTDWFHDRTCPHSRAGSTTRTTQQPIGLGPPIALAFRTSIAAMGQWRGSTLELDGQPQSLVSRQSALRL